ncbi:MAG: hypothetical protein GY801_40695 [bacterium]|nr:hypothetical protein [bacterium]
MPAKHAKHAKKETFEQDISAYSVYFAGNSRLKEHPDRYVKNADGSIKKPGAMDGDTWMA